jgi:hypothetical protein
MLWLCALSCRPTGQIERSTPVANLRSYRSVLVRVSGLAQAGPVANMLGYRTSAYLRTRCKFDAVDYQGPPAKNDLIVDLNIARSYRGGDAAIKNYNLHTLDVSLVLSDGVSDELLGSATIRGQSAPLNTTGLPPVRQAVDAVAQQVAMLMSDSGCELPRVARVELGAPRTPPPDSSAQDAERANQEGKEQFRQGDARAAKESFLRALALAADPRYQFNLCLAEESLNDLAAATSSCQKVLQMNPSVQLKEKVELRLKILRERRG